MKNIFPTIIFSESFKDGCFKSFFKKHIAKSSNSNFLEYFKFVDIDKNQIISENSVINIDLPEKGTKNELYKTLSEQGIKFSNIFRELYGGTSGFFSLHQTQNATNNGFNLKATNICFVFDADSPLLNTTLFPFLLNTEFEVDQPAKCPNVHVFINYQSPKEDEKYNLKCLANFKEIEEFLEKSRDYNSHMLNFYLIDDENENGFSLGDENNKWLVLSKYIEILFTKQDKLMPSYDWKMNEDKLCCLTTFGISSIQFPIDEIRELLLKITAVNELNQINESNLQKHDRLRIHEDVLNFYKDNELKGISNLISNLDGKDIWSPFQYDFLTSLSNEKENCINNKLERIELPLIRSKKITNEVKKV